MSTPTAVPAPTTAPAVRRDGSSLLVRGCAAVVAALGIVGALLLVAFDGYVADEVQVFSWGESLLVVVPPTPLLVALGVVVGAGLVAAAVLLDRHPVVAGLATFGPLIYLAVGDDYLPWAWALASTLTAVVVVLRHGGARGAVAVAGAAATLVSLMASRSLLLLLPETAVSFETERTTADLLVVPLLVPTLVLVGGCLLGLARAVRLAEGFRLQRGRLAAAEAVQVERARLARDLHDVIAHHVSLIAVRAESAPYQHPDMAPEATTVLAEIADDARRALDELRGVLQVLRRAEVADGDEGAPGSRAPQPGLQDVADLVERARTAGDDVSVSGLDERWVVDPVAGHVAYRVVQEGLTNARRHARGGAVLVRLGLDGDDLLVELSNSAGRGDVPTAGSTDHGIGIPAMVERVDALGGALDAGPTVDGGFRVAARLPLRTAAGSLV